MNAFSFRGLPAGIPAIETLAVLPHWVAWTYKDRGDSKPTKPPIDPHTGLRASHSDPRTWGTYEQATEIAIDRDLAGVGFVLSENDMFTGIDLDNCIRDDGPLEEWAAEVVALGETYTEISPSGRGLRMIAVGKVARAVKYDPAGVEIYGQQRYLTITGNHWPGTPLEIWEAPRTIAMLVARVETMKAANGGTTATREHTLRGSFGLENFYDRVKAEALANIGAWVRSLFPTARFQAGTGAWRVSSADLGRNLQEDISIHPDGIKDFGVHDMGDENDGGRTAIDLVIEHGDCDDAAEAALWLCDKLRIDPVSLGWQGNDHAKGESWEPVEAKSFQYDVRPLNLWGTFPLPEMPEGLLPKVIERFARIQSELIGADAAGLALAALCVCAAAIPDRIKVKVKRHDDWTEAARIWVALIGMPSTKKSPIIRAASRPLVKLDTALFNAWQREMAKYEALSKEDRKSAERPRQVRLRLSDTTMEAVQDILRDSPDGVLCVNDELAGWFGALDKYGGGKGSAKDRAFWNEAFNGGQFPVNRVGRGSFIIPNLSVCILGGIQPDAIRSLAADNVDDGLMQRLFTIVLKAASVGIDEERPDATGRYETLIERLRLLPATGATFGQAVRQESATLHFDSDAQRIRQRVEECYFDRARAIETTNRKLAAHVIKYNGLFARLCLIWHCVENVSTGMLPLAISASIAERVERFLDGFLFHHAVAFHARILGLSDNHDQLMKIASFILSRHLETLKASIIHRGTGSLRAMNRVEIHQVMQQMESYGWVEPVQSKRRPFLTHWAVNPRVHELFEQQAREERQNRGTRFRDITDMMGFGEEGDD